MPAPRIAMRRIREVLRLKDECGLTYSQIARSLQISKGSVANYLRGAEAAGLTHHEAALLDDAALSARLTPRPPAATKFAAPDFALVHRELKRKGVTLTLLWEEYRGAAVGVPYSRSRFFERYQDFVGTLRRSMRSRPRKDSRTAKNGRSRHTRTSRYSITLPISTAGKLATRMRSAG